MRFTLLLAAFTLVTQAQAEVGVIDPSAFGARFQAENVSRGLLRVTDPDGFIGTGFVIDADAGLIMTAAHVVSLKFDGTYTLTQDNGLTLHAVPLWKSASFDESVTMVRDVNQTMIQTLIWQQTRRGQYPMYEDLNPDYLKQRDAGVLRVVSEDLAAFKAAALPALKIRTTALAKGERLFLGGFARVHYHPGFLNFLGQALPQRAPLGNTTGLLTYKTGLYYDVQGGRMITRANPDQEQNQGFFLDSDALDTFQGDSGAPVLDQDGMVVAIHNASDASTGNPRDMLTRRSLMTAATPIGSALREFHASQK